MAEQDIFNTLYEYDPSAARWRAPVTAGTAPSPRTGHGIAVAPPGAGGSSASEAKVYLFGGSSPDDGPINDVFILTARLDGGAAAAPAGAPVELAMPAAAPAALLYSWEQIGTRGKAPVPREMHAALVLPPVHGSTASSCSGHFVIVGGRNEDGKPQLDAAVLDLSARVWLPAPKIPHPVVAAAVGTSHDGAVAYMYGGWSGATTLSAALLRLDMRWRAPDGRVDPALWVWSVLEVRPAPVPLPRFAAAGCFVGGIAAAAASGQARAGGSAAAADSPSPAPLEAAADAAKTTPADTGGRMFIFGGMHYERDFDELLTLTFE
jgi:hypothetical protein